MTDYRCEIVGAYFRPPAKGLLSALGNDTPLLVRREPSNEYDGNAIKVVMTTSELMKIDGSVVEKAIEGFGFTLADLAREDEWQLGYIPRGDASAIAGRMDENNVVELSATLGFSIEGKPQVKFSF